MFQFSDFSYFLGAFFSQIFLTMELLDLSMVSRLLRKYGNSSRCIVLAFSAAFSHNSSKVLTDD